MVCPHQSHWRLHYFSEKWWYVTLQGQHVLKPSGLHESPSEVVMAFLLAALKALLPNDSKPLRLSVARLWMMQSQGPETCSGEMKTVLSPSKSTGLGTTALHHTVNVMESEPVLKEVGHFSPTELTRIFQVCPLLTGSILPSFGAIMIPSVTF